MGQRPRGDAPREVFTLIPLYESKSQRMSGASRVSSQLVVGSGYEAHRQLLIVAASVYDAQTGDAHRRSLPIPTSSLNQINSTFCRRMTARV